MIKTMKNKGMTLAVILPLLVVLMFGVFDFGSVKAEELTSSVRLYSIDFRADDIPITTGVIGETYQIELWQNSNKKLTLNMIFRYDKQADRLYFNIAGNGYIELEIPYNALSDWHFKYNGREYIALRVDIRTKYSVNNIPSVGITDTDGNQLMSDGNGYIWNNQNKMLIDRYARPYRLSTAVSVKSKTAVMAVNDESSVDIIDSLGTPITVDNETGRISDGDYKIRSVSIDDKVIFVTDGVSVVPSVKTVIEPPWTNNFWVLVPFYGIKKYKEAYKFEYYDLNGHLLPSEFVVIDSRDEFVTIWQYFFDRKPVINVGDYLYDKVRNPIITPGTEAVDPENRQLYDVLGNPLTRKDGQVVDIMGWAVIGSDARPVFYDSDFNYYNFSGQVLSISVDDKLLDIDGKAVRSPVSFSKDGYNLYFLYLKDGITLIPATAKSESGYFYYYDLNGNKIDESIIILPEIDKVDYENKQEKESWLDKLMRILSYVLVFIGVVAFAFVVIKVIGFITEK